MYKCVKFIKFNILVSLYKLLEILWIRCIIKLAYKNKEGIQTFSNREPAYKMQLYNAVVYKYICAYFSHLNPQAASPIQNTKYINARPVAREFEL